MTWSYEAVNAQGNKVKGQLEAPSRDQAMEQVKALGLFPTRLSSLDAIPLEGPAAGRDLEPARGSSGEVAGLSLILALLVAACLLGVAFMVVLLIA
ncbi:MAG: hypothetical protein AB7N76_19880 [Planctomycetota bacterium]